MLAYYLRFLKSRILGVVAGAMLSLSVSAAPLEWSITSSVKSANPGDTLVFSGNITNNTGQPLESTDFFLDFLAFDSNYLLPNQELGIVPFILPDLTNSGNVTLFSVDVDPFAMPNSYLLSVLLQDINSNLTENIDIIIIISEIPEPSAAVLLMLGVITLLIILRNRKQRTIGI